MSAAVRLSMDDVVMAPIIEKTSSYGLAGVAATLDGQSVANGEAPAQKMLGKEPGKLTADEDGEGAKIEIDESDWTLDEWLKDYRSFEGCKDVAVNMSNKTYMESGVIRDANVLLSTPSIMPMKVGLMKTRVEYMEWKAAFLHEQAQPPQQPNLELDQSWNSKIGESSHGSSTPLARFISLSHSGATLFAGWRSIFAFSGGFSCSAFAACSIHSTHIALANAESSPSVPSFSTASLAGGSPNSLAYAAALLALTPLTRLVWSM